MQLEHLSLTNFRNFVRLEADFAPGVTLIVGANAQGKTSLLEAIHYLAGATSPHATSDRQLIHFLAWQREPVFARILAEIRRAERLERLEIRLLAERSDPAKEPRLRKEVLRNGLKIRVRELAGTFNAVLFLPQDLRVIEGPPAERRRYLDSALSQVDPRYSAVLSEYGKVLTQRNALLRRLQEGGNDSQQLRFWDEKLARLGGQLIQARARAVAELERLAAPIHAELTRDAEQLRIEYLPALPPLSQPNGQLDLPMAASTDWAQVEQEILVERLAQCLARRRNEEIRRGITLTGPHRDDLRLRVDGIDLRLYGSRGQNRTAMLAAKLAEVEWMHQRTGEWPVLLLDEVLAELDPQRRGDLLQRVLSAPQALLTTSDLDMFTERFLSHCALWEIRQGTLHRYPHRVQDA